MIIDEGKVRLEIIRGFEAGPGFISPGFYNRDMETSRDLTVAILRMLKPGLALDSMAGTGARGLRVAAETGWKVTLNDICKTNYELAKRNARLNDLDLEIWNLNYFTAVAARKWDYIDIDPYGTPIGFIDASLMNLRNNGIIGITMTDTANLEGKSIKKGRRLYGGLSQRGIYSREISTRIFIKSLLERGAALGLAGKPLISVREKHYIRAFIQFGKGSKVSDAILARIEKMEIGGKEAGPMYTGNLYDPATLEKISSEGLSANTVKLMNNFRNEDLMFLFFTNENGSSEPKLMDLIESIKKEGFKAGRTNFYEKGIKSDVSEEIFQDILKRVQNNFTL